MTGEDDLRKNHLHDSDLFRQPDPDEVELAFQLQNIQDVDMDVIQRMIIRYTANLYQWVAVLLFYQYSYQPEHIETLNVLREVYINAMDSVEQFHWHSSVENWLFSIALKITRKHKKRLILSANDKLPEKASDTFIISDSVSRLDILPDKPRLVVLLRYMFNRDINDIAHILDVQKKEVHNRLVTGRRILFGYLNTAHFTARMQAYLDRILEDQEDKKAVVEQHLIECTQCQQVILNTREKEDTLSKGLKKWGDQYPISDNAVKMLADDVAAGLRKSNGVQKVKFTFRQAAWIAGLTAMFIGLAVLFIRITPSEEEFPSPEPTTTQVLPAVIEMQPAIITNLPNTREIPSLPYLIIPDFSSDGNWGVFASIIFDPGQHRFLHPKVEVYERATNTTRVIYHSDEAYSQYWQEMNFSPSISADGRWIAFTSVIDDAETAGRPCKTRMGTDCLDIFLYDRQLSEFTRLSQGIDGAAADGNSMAPTVSEDGKYIAFWSAASNLTLDANTVCQPSENTMLCLYVHIYNQETRKFVKIPIPSIIPETTMAVDRISLSADGRYAAFTLYTPRQLPKVTFSFTEGKSDTEILTSFSAQHANVFNPGFYTSIIVYDLESMTAEFINPAKQIPSGMGSHSPVLSADGRYVAFISDSDDLLSVDQDSAGEVFLRDRVDGTIEMISMEAFDLPGYEFNAFSIIGERFYNLDLSADGRYVVFLAKVPILSGKSMSGCYDENQNYECNFVYIHDRQTGEAKWFVVDFNNGYPFFPKVTVDGKWISFMQSTLNCSAYQYMCSNVMMYSLQDDSLMNLTHYGGGETADLPWTYRGSINMSRMITPESVIAFSPDARSIAITGEDNMVHLGQVNTEGDSIYLSNQFKLLDTRASDKITKMEYSHEGNWLAGGSNTGKVYLWNLADGNLLYTVTGPTGAVEDIVFSEGGSKLVISTVNEIWVWNIRDKYLSKVNSILIDEEPVYDLKISPRGDLVASARGDGIVWLLTLPDGKTIGRLGGSREVIHNVAFSVDGSLLVTQSSEDVINLWQINYQRSNIPTITPLHSFMANNLNERLVISPGNEFLAAYGNRDNVMIWSLPGGEALSTRIAIPNRWVSDLAFSKHSPYAAGIINHEIFIWEIQPIKSPDFFSYASTDSFIEPGPLANATANDMPEFMEPSPGFSGKSLDLEQVAAYLHFPMLVPSKLPEYLSFREAMINNVGSLRLWYQVSYPDGNKSNLYIIEKVIGESASPTMAIGASAEVIPVMLESITGQKTAEYVRGDWIESMSFTEPADNSIVGEVHRAWHWDSSSGSQRLRWQQHPILIALYHKGDDGYVQVMGDNEATVGRTNYPANDQLDLIQIANSMRWYHKVGGNSWQDSQTPYE